MLNAIPILLSGDAPLYYLSRIKYCTSFEKATNELCLWCNNADELKRIVLKRKSLHLTEEFTNNHDAFEVRVFQILCLY